MSGAIYNRDLDTVVRGRGCANVQPIMKFSEAGLKPQLYRQVISYFSSDLPSNIRTYRDNAPPLATEFIPRTSSQYQRDVDKPTAIQKYSIPIILAGYDVVGLSNTGTGKTAAFLIPIIQRLLESNIKPEPETIQPQVLILAPTRELAIQIKEEADILSLDVNGVSAIITKTAYGGKSKKMQVAEIAKRGVHILTATPGRLKHFLKDNNMSFSLLNTIVIDEADQMLEHNFKTVVSELYGSATEGIRGRIQTLFYSATTSFQLEKNSRVMMRAGRQLTIEVGKITRASEHIEQVILHVPSEQKTEKLLELLRSDQKQSLIFVRTIELSKTLMQELNNAGISAVHISSNDMTQMEREEVLKDFKNFAVNGYRCLVSTDVCCRGIHISKLPHVINYDMPLIGGNDVSKRIRAYVHRIGRTGRMENKGLATSFFDPKVDSSLGPELYLLLRYHEVEIPDFIQQYERLAERTLMRRNAAAVDQGILSGLVNLRIS